MANESIQTTPVSRITIPVTYYDEWQDGFGARGWKLDCTMSDPQVIASTAEAGCCINTSVLIHDILDHYLCGLPMSGHRNEAIALIQLASRTGTDPRPDFAQMVDEDLMHGHISGEPLCSFISDDLRQLLPDNIQEDQVIINFLKAHIGQEKLRDLLINSFFELGTLAEKTARSTYELSGLDYHKRQHLGVALQSLLKNVDETALINAWGTASGFFKITNTHCYLSLIFPEQIELTITYN